MPGLGPDPEGRAEGVDIHDFRAGAAAQPVLVDDGPAHCPSKGVDGRAKPGHDGRDVIESDRTQKGSAEGLIA